MLTLHQYILFFLLIVSCFACGKSKEEKIQDAFLQDSLQYEETKRLKKSNQNEIEIDTAMNNPNSQDPAIPVLEKKEG